MPEQPTTKDGRIAAVAQQPSHGGEIPPSKVPPPRPVQQPSHNEEFSRALRSILRPTEEPQSKRQALNPAEMPNLLKRCYESLQIPARVPPGQLVRWKPGMRNRRFPKYGEPAIVIGPADGIIIAEQDEPASPYFREPLDLVIGILDEDGDFICFHVDSHRLEPWQ
jgi:hypothetical protein